MCIHVGIKPRIIVGHIISVIKSMIYYTQIVDAQWRVVISASWLLGVEHGQIHVLAIVYDKTIGTLTVGYIFFTMPLHCFYGKLVPQPLRPRHLNVTSCPEKHLLPTLGISIWGLSTNLYYKSAYNRSSINMIAGCLIIRTALLCCCQFCFRCADSSWDSGSMDSCVCCSVAACSMTVCVCLLLRRKGRVRCR